ncbi:MAG: cbb3-type cytochrome oxidase assembly protein CcoS [Cryomorphaceae bacterium]|nr:cbb3-type cytochrome oxidase assembly protein CcoS [Cryomorphaceae bacterium]
MEIIFVLIFISLFLAIGFLIAFLWSLKNGQFEDGESPAMRMLFEKKNKKQGI